MEFKYVVILICIALAAFLVFKEIRRNDKSQLIWRLIASLFMVISFALLIIPISYTVKKGVQKQTLNLLTAGVHLDSLAKIVGPKFSMDSLYPKASKVTHLADLNYYLAAHPDIKKINIYGYGLNEHELESLRNYQLVFFPTSIPSGIISANWPDKLAASQTLILQGIYNNATTKAVKLKLIGLGASLDSIDVKANSKIEFSFSHQPKQIGKAIYNLVALSGRDTVTVEPIPFEVRKNLPAKILILASFPDFEYKFLKQWLFENNYPIAMRSRISKDKFSVDFLNTKAIDINRLNQALLKNIDVLVIDEEEMLAISAADKASIYEAVANGMGLIIRLVNSKANSATSAINRYEVLSQNEKPLVIKYLADLTFNSLPFTQHLFLKINGNEQPLLVDDAGRLLVKNQLYGMGNIITTTIASTFQWQLAGRDIDYSKFWTLILEKTLRKGLANQSAELVPQFLGVNEKGRLIIDMNSVNSPIVSINENSLRLRQNMELPFKWDGYFWPELAGWQTVNINKNSESFYIYKNDDWGSLKNVVKIKNTSTFIKNQKKNKVKEENVKLIVNEELSKWWFFALFLMSISFLWYEQRFLSKK